MPIEKDNFLSTQTIRDSSGTDLNFVNKIIFYNDEFKFLCSRIFASGVWKKQLFEYSYNEKNMVSNINITNPNISGIVHPSISVPTVMIEGSQYTMFTYYIAKTDKLNFGKTNYYWYSCDEITEYIKLDEFASASINNLRRFFELLSENKNKV